MSTVLEVRVASPNRCWTLDKRGDMNWWNLRDVYQISWRFSGIDTTRAMEGSTSSSLTLGCVLGNSPPSDVALAVIPALVVALTAAIISPAVNSSSSSGSYTKCSSATISSGTTSATWTSSGPSVGHSIWSIIGSPAYKKTSLSCCSWASRSGDSLSSRCVLCYYHYIYMFPYGF